MSIDVVAEHSGAWCARSDVVAAYVRRPVPVLPDFPLLGRRSPAKQRGDVDELGLVLSVGVMAQQHVVVVGVRRDFRGALGGLGVPSVDLDNSVVLLLY